MRPSRCRSWGRRRAWCVPCGCISVPRSRHLTASQREPMIGSEPDEEDRDMAIDRAMIEQAASGGMPRPAPTETPEDETAAAPEGAGGLIQAAAGELNKLIESGELDQRVTKISTP